ncbi:hypothetical protein [Xylella fastidiosa]|uniref:hypothetical protein n=1 Tax=Xylella fastidiosa TaxID=2371 RepID=UPI00073398B6|nr:hypothetical protein [Xylella fastidiosa]
MNIQRIFKSLLKLCGIVTLTLLMVFGAILSCGKNNMTETTPHQAAAKNIKEVSKIMMLESEGSNYKRCFKFPQELYLSQFPPSMAVFFFKNLGYISGIEKSPGKFGEPRMSRVSLSFFPDKSAKEYYINSFYKKHKSRQVETVGEHKEFYLYNFPDYSYSAIDNNGLFIIEYKIGDNKSRNKEERIRELKLIIDFVAAHTIPCQGES